MARRVSEDFWYLISGIDGLVKLPDPPPLYREDGFPNWFKTVGHMVLEAEYRGTIVYVVYEQIWDVPCCYYTSHSSLLDAFPGEINWGNGAEVDLLAPDRLYRLRDIDPFPLAAAERPCHPLAGKTFVPVACQDQSR